MANASVEKIKALGLRHGEKAVMGVTAAICLMFLYMAATRPTIETTPEEVRKAASQAESNISRRQGEEDILKLLEAENIKNPNFEKMVDEQASNKIDAIAFRVASPWVSPEPGAGLIRDTPELIAPTQLVAYPGRGGVLIYEIKDGERVPLPPEDPNAPQNGLPQSRLNRRMQMASSGMMGGGMMTKKQQEQVNKKFEKDTQRVKSLLVGEDKSKAKEAEKKADATAGPFKETTKGLRWVSITGVLDYKTLRENYLTALKRKEVAYPHFKQVDIERQALQEDGTWSEWEQVDAEKNHEVLDNLPEHDEEWVPDPVRLERLVDPLPFLKAGYWEKVHVASLVPKEKKEVAKPQLNSGMMPGMMEGNMMPGGMEGGMMPGGMMNSGMMDMSMMEMGGMGMMGGTASDDMSFVHNEEELLMVRSLDFTVDPDTSYRFRLRIVVFNPNLKREDVAPGVDKNAIELAGPWSEPTEMVSVPADVATYALQKVASVGTTDQVQFEVTKWDPGNGVMVVRRFDAGPGDVIGSPFVVDIPNSDGTGSKREKIDFNSRQVVLDAMGGSRPIPKEIDNSRFEVPALSLVVRPDGSVAMKNQAFDEPNEVRKNVLETYNREKAEASSNKARESSSYFGGMPGMGP
ncbi:hypothetical protein [Singulisphaera acidiphila]|uniref:Uncharacterized protein n=1 Tax=Singulisphaera acidiphila (strain ATCC BAA-1392 / DSM 18658 / VKM B-2454 / MOB10) TaxID=886293 RepID=L0DKB2_SINAD|nr:hypothetical protein [Singulisphaera acidiphila]AGA29273.1 hypothetical protein Sinac_5121 [Singulisphaera acidiphila DSM 18658]